MDFLKKNPRKYFTAKDVSQALGICSSAANTSIRRLRIHKDVEYKYVKYKGYNTYLYKVGRKK